MFGWVLNASLDFHLLQSFYFLQQRLTLISILNTFDFEILSPALFLFCMVCILGLNICKNIKVAFWLLDEHIQI